MKNKKTLLILLLSISTLIGCNNSNTSQSENYSSTSEAKNESYKVTFKVDNRNYDVVFSSSASEIEFPETPTKTGYTFLGWYDSSNNQLTSSSELNSDITVYAKFKPINYNINYDVNGGTHDNTTEYTIEDEINLTEASKEGYTFNGWYQDGNKVTSINKGTTNNINLEAKYELIEYNINYNNTYGLTNDNNPTSYSIESGIIHFYDLPDRAGFTFKGWSYNNELSKTTELDSTKIKDDITLTAMWEEAASLQPFHYEINENNHVKITGIKNINTKEIIVPDYVYEISFGAFKDCKEVSKITLPFTGNRSNGEYYAVGYCFGAKTFLQNELMPSSLKEITITGGYSNNEALKTNSFYNCLNLTNIIIGDGVTHMQQSVFYDCIALESITLPFVGDQKEGLNAYRSYTLGYVFGTSTKFTDLMYNGRLYKSNNSSSVTIYIPNSLKTVTINSGEIFKEGFSGFSSIKKVILNDGVKKIGRMAFNECTNLEDIVIPSSIETIDILAFRNTKYDEKLNNEGQDADGFIYINDILYKYNGESETINIKEGTKAIAEGAFKSNKYIKKVICPISLRYIGSESSTSGAFYGCTNLTNIKLNEGLEFIGTKTFRNCTSLNFTDFPSTITFIGEDAFYETEYLSNLSDGEHYIGKVFYKYSGEMSENTTITIKEGTIGIAYGALSKTIVNSSSNNGFDNLVEVIMPDSVTWIGDAAFRFASNLKNIQLSKNLIQIGEQAFYNCSSLSNITLPKNLKMLKSQTFYGCNLDLMFDNNSSLEAILSYALNGLSSEAIVYLPKSIKYIEKNGLMTDATIILPIINAEIDAEAYGGTVFFNGTKFDSYQLDNVGSNFFYYSEYEPESSLSGNYDNYWHYDIDGTPVIWGNENKVYFTVLEGTESAWSYRNADTLFDGSNNTEWQIGSSVYNAEDGAYFIVESSKDIIIRGYTITVERCQGKGWPSYESNYWPQSWTIYGSNDLENWSEIITVDESGIYNPIVGYGYTYYQDIYFSISDNETSYKYYKVIFHSYDDLDLQIIQFKFEYPAI